MSLPGVKRRKILTDPRALPGPLIERFGLDAGVCFLNHGSFGATPTEISEEQDQWRQRLEREPVRWFVEDLEPALDAARERMARFVGCDAEGFAFVDNATAGVSTVVRSLVLAPGDELVTSGQEYNACNNALRSVAARQGARVVEAKLPWPVASEDELFEAVMAAVGPRTRLVMVSHVTSPTALVMPVERIVAALKERGIDTLVDGAHAPGYLPLNVAAINPAYYTGNFHKWCCAPKGSAFLWVRADRREGMQPLSISHGMNSTRTDRSRFRLEFDYTGSADMSAWLVTPECIDRVAEMVVGGWPAIRRQSREMALAARRLMMERFGTGPTCPESMVGAMATVAIPPRAASEGEATAGYHDPLWERLIAEWGIQVPVLPFPEPPRRHVRVSAAVYNRPEQYAYLADAIAAETGLGGAGR